MRLKLSVHLIVAFVAFTVIGTLSHELGHMAIAKALGYSTTLHYASINYDYSESNSRINEIYSQYHDEIKEGIDFPLKEEYESLFKKQRSNGLLVSLGGPLQTCLTGLIGILLLIYQRKKNPNRFNRWNWLGVFLALFWLREIFNLTISAASKLLNPKSLSFFGGDELFIAYYLNLWEGSVALFLGIIGLIISLLVIFKYLPVQFRPTFIFSGLIGGGLGYYLWIYQVGPLILP
ncbi:hypothetical protein BFP71_07585 [Roseivirga misakiensis]|uniref:Peptidase M50 domain-containing protein n=1 Tax=Roseivirga misakiensis TaxID=1563681 RepID=A0A1E5T3M5_9BACT|nr:hypothetical protein BFP71_07585 [Roseivirga misakiensis]